MHWDTGGSKNHLDAVVANVSSRVKNQVLVDVAITGRRASILRTSIARTSTTKALNEKKPTSEALDAGAWQWNRTKAPMLDDKGVPIPPAGSRQLGTVIV